MRPIIEARGVGKEYRLGERVAFRTLRESLAQAFRPGRLRARASPEGQKIWALRDVSFRIYPGEVVGVVGRNGAGKSTLLKVLSRVTHPTVGEVDLFGRVGSLLEVGTGFHPELTGRENVFLNGAILGMSRAEIRRKFDTIVDFAEIERFIDTPVKRYSSGMYVRLAFAVAAHLDPEILVVDEVLAVGDVRFQRKCLARLSAAGGEGRTVLFVSHNTAMLQALCGRGFLLEEGRLVAGGPIGEVVERYHRGLDDVATGTSLAARTDRRGTGALRFTGVRLLGPDGSETLPQTGSPLHVALDYRRRADAPATGVLRLAVADAAGHRLFLCLSRASAAEELLLADEGTVLCRIPRLPLLPGRYRVGVWAKLGEQLADDVPDAFLLDVLPGDFYGTGRLNPETGGSMLIEHEWDVDAALHAREE